MRSRSLFYGSSLTAYVLVVVGLFALVSYLSARHYKRFDLTKNGRYTLSPQTEKVLGRLPWPIKTLAFVKEDENSRIRAGRILRQYAYAANRFSWEFADPDKQPNLARNYGVTQYNTFVVTGGEGKKEILSGEFNEEKLTNAIIRLTGAKEHVVYFTKGHGEKDIHSRETQGYDAIRSALTDQNYKVEELTLFSEPRVPKSASALVVAGPEKGFSDAEMKKIEDYLADGGKALFLIDPFTAQDLAGWLPRFGIEPDNDVIVDNASRLVGGDALVPAVVNYEEHPITRGFRLMTMFPLARSMKVKSGPGGGITAFELAKTRADTWGMADQAGLKKSPLQYKEGKDLPGPLTIAAGAQIQKPGADTPAPKKGALVVVGDSDFAANAYLNIGGNRDLFMNAINWLAAEEDRISIASRAPEMDPLIFSAGQISIIAVLNALGIPSAVLVAGLWVIMRRRRY